MTNEDKQQVITSAIKTVMEFAGRTKESAYKNLALEVQKITNRRHTMFSEEDVSRMTIDELVDVIIETATLTSLCKKEVEKTFGNFLKDFNTQLDILQKAAADEALEDVIHNLCANYMRKMKEYEESINSKGILVNFLRNKAKTLLIRR